MSGQLHRTLERIMIFLMLSGIFGMFQPWVFNFFGWGFLILLAGTIGFTVISNITPRSQENPDSTILSSTH
jgi:hypothetical protein